jgi:hypothetical protein
MTFEHSFGDLPEIDQHKFFSIIQAYKNALVPRTEGDSSILDTYKMGLENEISEPTPEMTFPDVLNRERREYGEPNRVLLNHPIRVPITEELIRGHTSQPATGYMDNDFRNHLHSENIPHGASAVGMEDEYHTPTIFNVEGVPTAVSWDLPSRNKSLDFPHIVPFEDHVFTVPPVSEDYEVPEGRYHRIGKDDDYTLDDYEDRHESRQAFSHLVPERKDSLVNNSEAMLDPHMRAGGYTVPAHLLGRGERSRGRTSHFQTGLGIPTTEDDMPELKPKQGYSKWGNQ